MKKLVTDGNELISVKILFDEKVKVYQIES